MMPHQSAFPNSIQIIRQPANASCLKAGKGRLFYPSKGGRRRAKVYLLVFLSISLYMSSALANIMATWSCTPGAGQEVYMGDTIGYMLVVQTVEEEGLMTTLRVQLGKGMQMDMDSVSVMGEEGEKETASRDLALDNDGLGFVLMTDELQKGDRISFNATVMEADAEVMAAATVGDFRAEITHQLIASPEAEAQDEPYSEQKALGPVRPDGFGEEQQIEPPVQTRPNNGMQIFLLITCSVVLLLASWKFVSMLKELLEEGAEEDMQSTERSAFYQAFGQQA